MADNPNDPDKALDETLRQALALEVDEDRLARGVLSQISRAPRRRSPRRLIWAAAARWPAGAAAMGLAAAFALGLMLPQPFSTSDDLAWIGIALGDPAFLSLPAEAGGDQPTGIN